MNCPLTEAFLKGNLGDHAEESSFRPTAGHVEVKAVGHGDLAGGFLVLPPAVVLLPMADLLDLDGGVEPAAFGLAEVDEHEVSLHFLRNGDDPRDGGVFLHSQRPAGSGQKNGGVSLWRYVEYVSF